ncbi:uncharacterized protein BYT42DRAFT_340179 [Radiomyces spectabilis]|uniref:uncharacterized protein n=1 Tax=Radiomyces spectabilis TaxID=64574 RepID=UPI00221F7612|nr:uncharacterized protein BYT42DRAFT_340179 [Radiomyces spectabilis]KAI8379772.1 hypothetical protein BYT42DRAFT_340179 [Radiomyces spectabilis]
MVFVAPFPIVAVSLARKRLYLVVSFSSALSFCDEFLLSSSQQLHQRLAVLSLRVFTLIEKVCKSAYSDRKYNVTRPKSFVNNNWGSPHSPMGREMYYIVH